MPALILHLIRHAEAVERSLSTPDEYRCLTRRGRRRFRLVATELRGSGVHPYLILTSSAVRAVQTAEILAAGLRFDGDIAVLPGLAAPYRLADLSDMLAPHRSLSEIAIVGHEPDLGGVIAELLMLPQPVSLNKGNVLTLRVDPERVCAGAEPVSCVTGGGKFISRPADVLARLTGMQQNGAMSGSKSTRRNQ